MSPSLETPPMITPASSLDDGNKLTAGNDLSGKEDVSSDERDHSKDCDYWEDPDWIPVTKGGKQRSPNMIRGEMERYFGSHPKETKASVIEKLGVSSNSFYKFMKPSSYKDQWNATMNETYWEAAKFLEMERNRPKQPKSSSTTGKRKSGDGVQTTIVVVTKKAKQSNAEALLQRIMAVPLPEGTENKIYDTCPELVKNIKDFLAQQDGMTKAAFCRALDNLHYNSLTRFLAGKKQDQQANITYKVSWTFFEKKRLLDGKPKSKKRLINEKEHPNGFSTDKVVAGYELIYSIPIFHID